MISGLTVYMSKPMYGGELVERIASTALDGTLERSDVLCVVNHNPNRGVLARFRNGGGSLSLTVDDKGLKYAFEAPNTALGDELVESLKRGDITESSFCFSCKKDKYDKRADGVYEQADVRRRACGAHSEYRP